MRTVDQDNFAYDVALSFAGEDRAHAEKLAQLLKAKGIKVFYDEAEAADLWGKDLIAHLADNIIRDDVQPKDVIVSDLLGHPVESLRLLGRVERPNEHSVFLYPAAFERAKYERRGPLGKLWTRILLRRRDAVLAVTTTATFILVILQIAEIIGWF